MMVMVVSLDEHKVADSAPCYFATGEPLRTSDGIPETRGDDRHDPPSAASTRTTDSLLQHDCQESNGHCKLLFPPNSRKPSAEAKGESFSRLLGGRARSILARLKEPALFQMNFNVDGWTCPHLFPQKKFFLYETRTKSIRVHRR